MVTRSSRRLYSYRGRSTRAYRFPSRYRSSRGGTRRYRGYGSYYGIAASLAARAAPYAYRAFKAYRKGGAAGVKAYARRAIGSAASRAIKTYTGYGAYKRVGKGGMTGLQAPSIRNAGGEEGCIVISHKEYMGEVKSSTNGAMAIASYNINPGDPNTFPFLAQIARNFQEYRLEGMCFTFRSMYADATAVSQTAGTPSTNAQGSVIMATQYDPTEPPPGTKQELVNLEFSQTAKPSESMTHFIECAKGSSPLSNLYIATSPQSQKGDERFYNFGTFNIATLGIPALNATLGELWVSYQVRLYKPKLNLDDSTRDRYFYWGVKGAAVASNASPFGNEDMTDIDAHAAFMYEGSNYFPVAFSGAKISFPGARTPKSYIVELHYKGTATEINSGVLTIENASFNSNIFSTGGDVSQATEYMGPFNGDTSAYLTMTFAVAQGQQYTNGQPWSIYFSTAPTLPESITIFRMFVSEIPYYATVNQN